MGRTGKSPLGMKTRRKRALKSMGEETEADINPEDSAENCGGAKLLVEIRH